MNKKLNILLVSLLSASFVACSDDDDSKFQGITVDIQYEYQTPTFKLLTIDPTVDSPNASYRWTLIKNPVDNRTDSVLSTTKELEFIAVYSGIYMIDFEVTDGNRIVNRTTVVNVSEEATKFDPYITRIYDYDPAPGTFGNECYKNEGATKEDVMKIALGRIDKTSVGYPLDLGNFGGSIVVGFDHTVVNVPGQKDFRIYGKSSTFAQPVAPGLVFVAYDKNKNGQPDADEWFEIKGSAHDTQLMDANFSITYYRPAPDKKPIQTGPGDAFYDRESVLCENSDGESYYLTRYKNKPELCPSWVDKDKFTYAGKRFDVNLKRSRPDQYTGFNFDTFDWGYANAKDPDIDIDWAVDKDGKAVHLPGVDFIKIFNCVSSGEEMMYSWTQNSMNTKFAGAADLHILEKYKLKTLK